MVSLLFTFLLLTITASSSIPSSDFLCLLFGLFVVRPISFSIFIIIVSLSVHVHKVTRVLAEIKVVLESFPVVQVVEVENDLHRLIKGIKKLFCLFIRLFIVFVPFGHVGSFSALETVKETFSGDSLYDLTSFTSLLVLLLFLDLFLAQIFTIFPFDKSALSFYDFVSLIIFKASHER